MALKSIARILVVAMALNSAAYGQSAQPVIPLVANAAVSATNPMPVTPISGGTAQDVNITKILGAAPSLTNPLFVSPATGATFPVSAASLPLPALAATSTLQTSGAQKTQIVNGSGNVIGATSNALDVNIKSGFGTTIAVTQSTTPWIVAGGGTAGTAATGVVTVQGIASMTPLLATATLNQGGTVLSATNGIFSNVLQGNAVLSATNGLYSNLVQGNVALSATNGLYSNLLQGNAVISATNGLYGNILQGNAVLSTSNPIFITGTGTAGSAATNPITVQGITSMTPLLVTPSNPIGITPTDRTITSATGSSQTVAASNASRHSLIIQNTGNANCGINPTGGTASIGGAGTLTLVPNGSYQPRIPTLTAITAICTAGQPLYAEEN